MYYLLGFVILLFIWINSNSFVLNILNLISRIQIFLENKKKNIMKEDNLNNCRIYNIKQLSNGKILIKYKYKKNIFIVLIKNNDDFINFYNMIKNKNFNSGKNGILSAIIDNKDITNKIKEYEGPNGDFYSCIDITINYKDIFNNETKDITIIKNTGDLIRITSNDSF